MLKSIIAAAGLVVALAIPSSATAQNAWAAPGLTNMRAGPGLEYPVVAQILGGSGVDVIGCLADYSWCDSTVQGVRGWVSTTRLQFLYAGQRVYVPEYPGYFRAPVVTFSFGYWDNFYRDRPFYRERYRWDREWDGPEDEYEWRDGRRGRGRLVRDRDVEWAPEPEYRRAGRRQHDADVEYAPRERVGGGRRRGGCDLEFERCD